MAQPLAGIQEAKMATKRTFSILTGVVLGCSLIPSTLFAQQGSYRPVDGQTSTGNAQGQFPPTDNRGTTQRWSYNQTLPSPRLPAQPQATPSGIYAPPGYSYNAAPYPAPMPGPPSQYDNRGWNPGISMDPTDILDSFFGGPEHDAHRPGIYIPPPSFPFSPPVAPVYNPPVPATPAQPAYGGYSFTQQPQQGYRGDPARQEQQQPTIPDHYAATPTTAQQPKAAEKPKAPRPFSNPQESGSSFPPRSTRQAGRSDPRFRPPELKGTP